MLVGLARWQSLAVACLFLGLLASCESAPGGDDDAGDDDAGDDDSSTDNDCDGAAGSLAGVCFSQVSAGGAHTCAIDGSGAIVCWGNDASGQSTPPGGSFSQVSAGVRHTCAIDTAGGVQCWGAGRGEAGGNCGTVGGVWFEDCGQSSPPSGTFTQVSAGGWHSCGVDSSGQVACWGMNNGSEEDWGQVTDMPTVGSFSQVSAGWRHACGLENSGQVACWGFDNYGQSSPPSGDFTQVSVGGWHACGLGLDDTVQCWGIDNGEGEDLGQVGDMPNGVTATQVSAGLFHTCALDGDGGVECWGADWVGQSTPLPGVFGAVSAGHNHNCAIDPTGAMQCWGDDASGQSTPP